MIKTYNIIAAHTDCVGFEIGDFPLTVFGEPPSRFIFEARIIVVAKSRVNILEIGRTGRDQSNEETSHLKNQ